MSPVGDFTSAAQGQPPGHQAQPLGDLPDVTPRFKLESGPHHSTWIVETSPQTAAQLSLESGLHTLTQLDSTRAATRAAERLCSLTGYRNLLRVDAVSGSETTGESASNPVERHYIWYEPAEAGTLTDYCQARGPLPIDQVSTIVRALTSALSYLHEEEMTYSHLTASHLVFTIDGTVKLLAPDIDLRHQPQAVCAAKKADTIAACAAIIWLCYTGEEPKPQRLRAPLPLVVPEVPPALATLLEDAIDSRAQQPTLADLAALSDFTADPAPLELHLSAHESVVPRLPAYRPPQNTKAAPKPAAQRRKVYGQVRDLSSKPARSSRPLGRLLPTVMQGGLRNKRGKTLARSAPSRAKILTLGSALLLMLALAGWWAAESFFPSTESETHLATHQGPGSATPKVTEETDALPELTGQAEQPDNLTAIDDEALTDRVTELIELRSEVLAQGQLEGISGYALPGSTLYEQDQQLLTHPDAQALAATRTHLVAVHSLKPQLNGEALLEVTIGAEGFVPAGTPEELAGAGIKVDHNQVTQRVELTLTPSGTTYFLTRARPQP